MTHTDTHTHHTHKHSYKCGVTYIHAHTCTHTCTTLWHPVTPKRVPTYVLKRARFLLCPTVSHGYVYKPISMHPNWRCPPAAKPVCTHNWLGALIAPLRGTAPSVGWPLLSPTSAWAVGVCVQCVPHPSLFTHTAALLSSCCTLGPGTPLYLVVSSCWTQCPFVTEPVRVPV